MFLKYIFYDISKINESRVEAIFLVISPTHLHLDMQGLEAKHTDKERLIVLGLLGTAFAALIHQILG